MKLNSHKPVKYLCNQSNKCNGKDASFSFKIGWTTVFNGC